MSKVEILRALITEKMTVALREILAVVQTTVAGYEDEVLSLKQELGEKRQLEAILQPRVRLHRIDLDDAGGAPSVLSSVSADESKEESSFKHNDIDNFRPSEKWFHTGENGVDGEGTNMCHEEPQLDYEESEGSLVDIPTDGSESCPENTEEGLTHDPIPDVRITQHKRKPRLPGRYKSNHNVTDENSEKDNNWKSYQYLKSSKVNKRPVITVRIGFLKNCPDADPSNKALTFTDSVQTILCQQNVSESDFINNLRSTFPELGENKPFVAFLTDRIRSTVPNGAKRITPSRLYRAFTSHKGPKLHFYIKLKVHDKSFDINAQTPSQNKPMMSILEEAALSERGGTSDLTDEQEVFSMACAAQSDDGEDEKTFDAKLTEMASHDKPTSSGPEEEAPSETGGPGDLTHEQKNVSSMDCGAQSHDREDGEDNEKEEDRSPEQSNKNVNNNGEEDDDETWSPEQSSEDEEHGDAPRRGKLSNSCKLCGTSFSSIPILTKHALSHLDHPKCMCGVCGQQLESSQELKSHLETHQKLHQCGACGRYFLTYVHFRKHSMTCQFQRTAQDNDTLWTQLTVNQQDKPHKCDVCPQSFRFKKQLLFHNSEHTGKAPFWCGICGKSMKHYKSYLQHEQAHTGEKNYSCQHCGMQFYYLEPLKRHEKIHLVREKIYLCDICSKAFHSEFLLKQHQKIHRETPTVSCPVCHKLVKERHLGHHMAIHKKREPVSCKECGMKFKIQRYLNNHIMYIHRGIKPFTCTVCGYKCARKPDFKDHMNTHTGYRPYRCPECGKTFTQKHCLKTHMKREHTEEQ